MGLDSVSPKKKDGVVIKKNGIYVPAAVIFGLLSGAAGYNVVTGYSEPVEIKLIQDYKDIQKEQNNKLEAIKNEQNQLKSQVILLSDRMKRQKEILDEIKSKLEKSRWKR